MTDLERRLTTLATDYPFPPTPDLAGAAGRRVSAATPARRSRARRLVLALAVVVLALGGTLALSSGARGALVDLFDLVPGVRIERAAELPEMTLAEADAYGMEISLAEAERRAPFDVLRPESLGEPDHVYHYRDEAGGDIVTVLYGGRRDARVVLTIWPLESLLAHKIVGPGTDAEIVEVRGVPGIWISGSEHAVFYVALDRHEQRLDGALAGNVLVWQEGELAYRLEAGVTRDRALVLAAELR